MKKSQLKLLLIPLLLCLWAEAQTLKVPFCSRVYIGPTPSKLRSWTDLKTLRIMEMNMENLFDSPNKPQKKMWKKDLLALHIKRAKPDVAVLVETESHTTVKNFLREQNIHDYEALSMPGNDSRGITITFLVKKDLKLDVELVSHKEELWDPAIQDGNKVFSRDLPVLMLRQAGKNEKDAPDFILVGTHYKSKRDSENAAVTSDVKRAKQVERTEQILSKLREEHGRRVPIVLTGDFNDDVRTSPVFNPLKTKFKDAFNTAQLSTPEGLRGTHFYYGSKEEPINWGEKNQLDTFFINNEYAPRVLRSLVLDHRDMSGNPISIPKTFGGRDHTWPSDHRPIFMELKLVDENIPLPNDGLSVAPQPYLLGYPATQN